MQTCDSNMLLVIMTYPVDTRKAFCFKHQQVELPACVACLEGTGASAELNPEGHVETGPEQSPAQLGRELPWGLHARSQGDPHHGRPSCTVSSVTDECPLLQWSGFENL